ncbi:MAG TPA: GNAT family N-acetyltransferase [Longimicrobiales bacterium]
MTDVAWTFARFAELSPADVHDLLRLRQDVFVIEQNCIFHEIDGRDPQAWHLLGRRGDDAHLVAYARVFEPGVTADEATIGRVVTDPSARGAGLGHALMREAMAAVDRIAPGSAMRLAAQHHLQRFYAAYGFRGVGEKYIEDDIWHLDMVRPAQGAPDTGGPAA